ncbi:MAG: putative DNA-binding domain-containing protein [Methylococcaceae bacterium]|jgi:uncharacterized protein|nr:putative DNA-binding domain-containing protein [Methylococcaceae bacterium]
MAENKNNVFSFQEKQAAFTDYLRNPQVCPVPEGVIPERIDIHRELMFNNISSFLETSFPILRSIIEDNAWKGLCQDYFLVHHSKTPYFSEIPEEFLFYLQEERVPRADDHPFILELAHYEWVEMALAISLDEQPKVDDQLTQKPLTTEIALSPLAWPLAYQYPVHLISSTFKPQCPPETATFLLVYRSSDLEVNFIEMTPLTFRLLQLLQQQSVWLLDDCLNGLAREFVDFKPGVIYNGGLDVLQELAARGIVYQP